MRKSSATRDMVHVESNQARSREHDQPVLNHLGYVLPGNGAVNSRILLEVILAAAVISTAVTLYPVVSRH